MLNKFRIVLLNTSHPGNIGSVARAMKNMGLTSLYLVNPLSFPHEKATELASNATDILENAQVTTTLDDAIYDCDLIVGTSARTRKIPWPLLSPREWLETLAVEKPGYNQIAILFGCEKYGLPTEILQRCHYHLYIPTHPEYNSLNLAAAVQIIAYECYVKFGQKDLLAPTWDNPYATATEIEKFYTHLERVLIAIRFLDPATPRQLLPRIRRLFTRTKLDMMEVNILRGILNAIEKNTIKT